MSEWISVKERLPEKNTKVLCYFKYEPNTPDVICENVYYGSGRWMSESSKVTHWMPLPEPPEKEIRIYKCDLCALNESKPCYECNMCRGGYDHFRPIPKPPKEGKK